MSFLLYWYNTDVYKFRANLGLRTNNWVELTILFLLFKFIRKKGVTSLHVYGDSSLVILFLQGQALINNLYLYNLAQQVYLILPHFNPFRATNIYRELNDKVDPLSKQGFLLQEGNYEI